MLNWSAMLPPERLAKGMWWGEAWSLIGGCSPVSEGCDNCWSAGMAENRAKVANPKIKALYGGQTVDGVFNGTIRLNESQLDKPLKTKKPTVFSIWNDLFHVDVPDEFIDRAFAIMALCPQHLFIILTKRPERMRQYFGRGKRKDGKCQVSIGDEYYQEDWPLSNVVLGTSVENQTTADERIPHLLATPSACRFVSYEPALGPVEWKWFVNPVMSKFPVNLDLIIMGGESGKNARPMHPDWARKTRDDCEAAGVSFFFKQWGEWSDRWPLVRHIPDKEMIARGHPKAYKAIANKRVKEHEWPDGRCSFRVGKKKAGRELDGVIHNDLPEVG